MALAGEPSLLRLALTSTPLTSQPSECTRCRARVLHRFSLQRRRPRLYSNALPHCRHSASLWRPRIKRATLYLYKKSIPRRDTVLDLPTIAQHSPELAGAARHEIISWISDRSPLTEAKKAIRHKGCCSEEFPPQPAPERDHLTAAIVRSAPARTGKSQRHPADRARPS
jgi:hypothetical protein